MGHLQALTQLLHPLISLPLLILYAQLRAYFSSVQYKPQKLSRVLQASLQLCVLEGSHELLCIHRCSWTRDAADKQAEC